MVVLGDLRLRVMKGDYNGQVIGRYREEIFDDIAKRMVAFLGR